MSPCFWKLYVRLRVGQEVVLFKQPYCQYCENVMNDFFRSGSRDDFPSQEKGKERENDGSAGMIDIHAHSGRELTTEPETEETGRLLEVESAILSQPPFFQKDDGGSKARTIKAVRVTERAGT